MKKIIFLLAFIISAPALASTDVNFDTTATGTTSSYLANSTNAYWQDNNHFNLSIGDNNLQTNVSQSGGGSHGTLNLAVGVGALTANTTGNQNLAIGVDSLMHLTTAAGNVVVGNSSIATTNPGDYNTTVGSGALAGLSAGSTSNTAIGGGVGVVMDGSYNTFIGMETAQLLGLFGSSNSNTLIGYQVGSGANAFSNNIGIGYDSTVSFGTFSSNQLNIQNAIHATGLGNTSSTPKIGLGNVPSPTARVHFPAGAAGAGLAPIKLTPGTLLTTPEDGALEYDGTHLYFTIGSTRSPIL